MITKVFLIDREINHYPLTRAMAMFIPCAIPTADSFHPDYIEMTVHCKEVDLAYVEDCLALLM